MAKRKVVKRKTVKKAAVTMKSQNPWFRKREGAELKKGSWGFIPINWKGWLALALLIIVNVFAALYFELYFLVGKMWAKFGVVFLLCFLNSSELPLFFIVFNFNIFSSFNFITYCIV